MTTESKYSVEQLQQMAVITMQLYLRGDPRASLLVMTVAARANLSVPEVLTRIEEMLP